MRVIYLLVTLCVAIHAIQLEEQLTEKRNEVLSALSSFREQKLKEFKDFLQEQDLKSDENQRLLVAFFTRLQKTADWYNTHSEFGDQRRENGGQADLFERMLLTMKPFIQGQKK